MIDSKLEGKMEMINLKASTENKVRWKAVSQ